MDEQGNCATVQRLARAELLIATNRAVAGCRSAEEAIAELARRAMRALDADQCLVYLGDGDDGGLAHREPGGGKDVRVVLGAGVAGRVLASGAATLIEDTDADASVGADVALDRCVEAAAGLAGRSIACVPLPATADGILGVALCLHPQPRRFGTDSLDLLAEMCAHAAPTLEMWRERASCGRVGLVRQRVRGPVERLLGTDSAPASLGVMATILFADIRGFTGIAQRLGPSGTVALLNEYFDVIVGCLEREGGLLDKFIGDAVMATFGVPASSGEDEDRAVRAAVRMLRALGRWNRTRAESGLPAIEIGIGINSDVVVAGDIGSASRTDYTVIGDGVNLAARLQRATRVYRTPVLISERTRGLLKGRHRLRRVDTVRVRGRAEPVTIHEVLDHRFDDDVPGFHADGQHEYELGMRHYQERRFAEAADAFTRAAAADPDDRLARLYHERCLRLRRKPPSADWDGSWRLAGDTP